MVVDRSCARKGTDGVALSLSLSRTLTPDVADIGKKMSAPRDRWWDRETREGKDSARGGQLMSIDP